MANWYIWHAATGLNDGTSWTNAYTAIAPISTKAAGDIFFVAHDHAQTSGTSLTITSPGVDNNPCYIYCVDRAGSVPPVEADLRTTGQITTTGTAAISVHGSIGDCYGIIFNAGTGSTTTNCNLNLTANKFQKYTNCHFKLLTTVTSGRINMGAGGYNVTELIGCKVTFSHVGQQMSGQGRVIIRDTPADFLNGTVPTTLFGFSGPGGIMVEAIDLDNDNSTLVSNSATNQNTYIIIKDCALGSPTLIASPTGGHGQTELMLIRSDNITSVYRMWKFSYAGSVVTSATVYRVGGATDGTTPIGWIMGSTANNEWAAPVTSPPITVWNESVGVPITITIEAGLTGAVLPVSTSAAWIEVVYFDQTGAGNPIGKMVSSGIASFLGAVVNYSASAATWSATVTNPFKMSVTVTPLFKGPITIYVKWAAVVQNMYIDPKPVIT